MPKPDPGTENKDLIDIAPMLTLQDLACMLGLSKRTVAAWRAEGYLCEPDVEHGKTLRWKRETVEAWLAEQPAKAR